MTGWAWELTLSWSRVRQPLAWIARTLRTLCNFWDLSNTKQLPPVLWKIVMFWEARWRWVSSLLFRMVQLIGPLVHKCWYLLHPGYFTRRSSQLRWRWRWKIVMFWEENGIRAFRFNWEETLIATFDWSLEWVRIRQIWDLHLIFRIWHHRGWRISTRTTMAEESAMVEASRRAIHCRYHRVIILAHSLFLCNSTDQISSTGVAMWRWRSEQNVNSASSTDLAGNRLQTHWNINAGFVRTTW